MAKYIINSDKGYVITQVPVKQITLRAFELYMKQSIQLPDIEYILLGMIAIDTFVVISGRQRFLSLVDVGEPLITAGIVQLQEVHNAKGV